MTQQPTYVILPMRFTPKPDPMAAFLEAVGLRRVLTSDSQTFVHFVGLGGEVAVHGPDTEGGTLTEPHTALNLLTVDVAAAANDLATKGVGVDWWDESYGRQGVFRDARGRSVGLNEVQTDTYGYQDHGAVPGGDIVVTAIVYSTDFEADAERFGHFGFRVLPGSDENWTALSAGPRSGVIGLHAPFGRVEPEGSTDAWIELGLETTSPLEVVRDRLLAAGHDAEIVSDENATKVHVTDPDGFHLEIHPYVG
ncbi:hypothetical protein [Aestuariimicrobium ganziense]|uniref:hypothetical protein n=1 Tax=Aestuariimicrobium ganziense TaxID=2773677 RepID=UPI001943CB92|nr:hypothetical protein [Aestuariimicrobium ganziense]